MQTIEELKREIERFTADSNALKALKSETDKRRLLFVKGTDERGKLWNECESIEKKIDEIRWKIRGIEKDIEILEKDKSITGAKAYVITEGDYSDYCIVAVFATIELAWEFTRLYGGCVEIHELINEQTELMKTKCKDWSVWFDRDGNVDRSDSNRPGEDHGSIQVYADFYFNKTGKIGVYNIVTDSEEKAVKTAIDCRRQFIAQGYKWNVKP